jgi:hypothetical protein
MCVGKIMPDAHRKGNVAISGHLVCPTGLAAPAAGNLWPCVNPNRIKWPALDLANDAGDGLSMDAQNEKLQPAKEEAGRWRRRHLPGRKIPIADALSFLSPKLF